MLERAKIIVLCQIQYFSTFRLMLKFNFAYFMLILEFHFLNSHFDFCSVSFDIKLRFSLIIWIKNNN